MDEYNMRILKTFLKNRLNNNKHLHGNRAGTEQNSPPYTE